MDESRHLPKLTAHPNPEVEELPKPSVVREGEKPYVCESRCPPRALLDSRWTIHQPILRLKESFHQMRLAVVAEVAAPSSCRCHCLRVAERQLAFQRRT